MNVRKFLATGKGGNIIQGAVAIDDETEKGCTEIVPGFHHRLAAWWKRVEERMPDSVPDAYVTNVDGRYLKEDEAEFGEFVKVPCRRGGARITRPDIIHGSTTAPSTKQPKRRTILPWFVGVRDDKDTLDNKESDTWSELALAHLRQEAPKVTPSGLPNRFGSIPYRFPATVQLVLENAVSQARVCRLTWDDGTSPCRLMQISY